MAVPHLLGASQSFTFQSATVVKSTTLVKDNRHVCFCQIMTTFKIIFYNIIKMLCTPAIQVLLKLHQIHSKDVRVRAMTETLLFELKSEKMILEVIDSIYADLVMENGDDLALVS